MKNLNQIIILCPLVKTSLIQNPDLFSFFQCWDDIHWAKSVNPKACCAIISNEYDLVLAKRLGLHGLWAERPCKADKRVGRKQNGGRKGKEEWKVFSAFATYLVWKNDPNIIVSNENHVRIKVLNLPGRVLFAFYLHVVDDVDVGRCHRRHVCCWLEIKFVRQWRSQLFNSYHTTS